MGKERVLGPYEQHNGWRVVRVLADGTRKSRVLPTEGAARRYIDVLLAELESSDHTTESALAEYRKHLRAKGDSDGGIVVVEWAVNLFFPKPVTLSMLSQKHCARRYEEIRATPSEHTKRPLAADTHRGALSRVKQFFGWCVERGWLKTNPVADIKGIGKRRPRGKSLGRDGNELRVKQAREWYYKALTLADKGDEGAVAGLTAMLLGMRAGEIVSRRVRDLDEDSAPGDLLWIPCSKTPAGRRTLEVPEVLRPHLLYRADAKKPDRYLFELDVGVPHDNGWVRRQIHRICKAAKVQTVTAHAMRGLLATLTSERGLAGHLIAATLGHESYENMTLKAYAAPGSRETGVNRRGLTILKGGAK